MNKKIYLIGIIMLLTISIAQATVLQKVFDNTSFMYVYGFQCTDNTCLTAYVHPQPADNSVSYIHVTTNGGQTWTLYNTTGSQNNGYDVFIDAQKNGYIVGAGSPTLQIYNYTTQTYTNIGTLADNAWYMIGSRNSTGRTYFYANSGWTSTDFGMTKDTNLPVGAGNNADCNANTCQYQLVCGGVSSNYGVNFTEVSYDCYDTEVSPTGKNMLMTSGMTSIYISKDYGTTWKQINVTPGYEVSAGGITDTGYVITWGTDYTNSVFAYSTDMGDTWVYEYINDFEASFNSAVLTETGTGYIGGANYTGLDGYETTYYKFQLPTIPVTSSSPGKTRYLVDASGNVVGVIQGQQLLTQPVQGAPQLSIAGEGTGFDILAWLKDLWNNLFGGSK